MSPKVPCILLSLTVLCTAAPTAALDDSYGRAIDRAAQNTGSPKGRVVQNHLKGSMWNWMRKPAFQRIRLLASALPPGRSEIRLEIGNENAGAYRVIWLRDIGDRVVVLVSMDGGKVDQRTIAATAWVSLVANVRDSVPLLPACKSDLTVSDGSSYFGSLHLNGQSTQFAVYGLNFFPDVSATQRKYSREMAPCKAFVDQIFRAVGLRAAPKVSGG